MIYIKYHSGLYVFVHFAQELQGELRDVHSLLSALQKENDSLLADAKEQLFLQVHFYCSVFTATIVPDFHDSEQHFGGYYVYKSHTGDF